MLRNMSARDVLAGVEVASSVRDALHSHVTTRSLTSKESATHPRIPRTAQQPGTSLVKTVITFFILATLSRIGLLPVELESKNLSLQKSFTKMYTIILK